MAFVLDSVLNLGTTLIERLIPDKAKADEAKLKLLELQMSGELKVLEAETQMALKQGEINAKEAESEHIFVSGWRPAIGWICGLSLGAKYLVGPFCFFVAQFYGITLVLPPIDMTEMLPILLGMLGLGGLRTWEKIKTK